MYRALIVEDDPKIRAGLGFHLRQDGFEVVELATAEDARAALADGGRGADLLLLDVRLPGISGVELVRRLTAIGRLPPTVVISGEASIGETVEALRLGVHDFIEKPFSRERLMQSVRNALEHDRLRREVETLSSELSGGSPLLGRSPAIEELREQIAQAGPTDARVLILGESGSGKELVADALHRAGPRRRHAFVKLNCAAIPQPLIEAELFGHARGAFTDAHAERAGLFEEADGGTLFLDEIGDLAPTAQARLLRVLEDGRVRRVGENRDRRVDARILAATNQDLEAAAADGRFRRDLYFRLSSVPIRVPPLRERIEDVRLLFSHFVELYRARHRTGRRRIDESVYPVLERHGWPGNVRELRALAERMVVLGGDPITAERLPPELTAPTAGERPARAYAETGDELLPLREHRARAERAHIERVLQSTGWNFTAAAAVLEIDRTHLHEKARTLGIRRPEAREVPESRDG